MHQDPVTKSQRLTDSTGTVTAGIDLDPWGGETSRTFNGAQLSKKYTTYDRNANGRDEAMMRSYHAWFSRFDQPDPYDGAYDLADPQSLNRYAYVQNDPVNFVDPSGLDDCGTFENPCPVVGPTSSAPPWPDYSGLWSLILGRWELDRALEMPVGNEVGGGLLGGIIGGGAQQDPDRYSASCNIDGTYGPYIAPKEIIDRYGNERKPRNRPLCGNGQCPVLPQTLLGIPRVRNWREGAPIFGNNSIARGTVIATFVNGEYPDWDHGNHAAIYLSQDKGGIWVIDQWPSRGHSGIRYIPALSGEITEREDDARAFSAVHTLCPQDRKK